MHPGDATRIDLTIPTEAHFCVKSATPQERQQWLVALGSSKACLTNIAPAATTQPGEALNHLKLKNVLEIVHLVTATVLFYSMLPCWIKTFFYNLFDSYFQIYQRNN